MMPLRENGLCNQCTPCGGDCKSICHHQCVCSSENHLMEYSLVSKTKPISDSIFPIPDPKSEFEAMTSPQKSEWIKAKDEEMKEIWLQNTYELVPPQKGAKIIPSRFVYKIKWRKNTASNTKGGYKDHAKTEPQYIVDRFKARWVVQGYNLKKNVDFTNSYAFVVGTDSERIQLTLGYH